MNRIKAFILMVLLLVGIWLLLTAPFSMQELIAGAAIAILLALLPTGANTVFADVKVSPRAVAYAVAYVFVFLIELVKVPKIETTKFRMRWFGQLEGDPRYCSFD